MKSLTLTLTALVLLSTASFAKRKKKAVAAAVATEVVAASPAVAIPAVAPDPHAGHDHAKEQMVAPKTAPQVNPALTNAPVAAPVAAAPQATPEVVDKNIKFVETEHDFGTLPEGPQAITEFKFKNTGKEPIDIVNVQASCGCTVPEWTKEPVAPGKTATIKAIYNTQGRPGSFTKNLTLTTKQGFTKVLTIKGNVEKAPATSVPTNDQNMMIKH